jgi:hypothetical protein
MQPFSPTRNPTLADSLIEPLTKVAEDLAEYMGQGAKGRNFHELVGRVAEIGYLSTQHGSYVIEKGRVKPDSI